jgi:thymidylate synthase (FAD)
MKIRIIGITKSLIPECDNAQELVTYAARVSNPTNQANKETSSKLIKYLLKHKHFSPFEMVHILMEITTTRDISRQILRHRSFSFQEFSQRYAKSSKFITREIRLQDSKNRQNSLKIQNDEFTSQWDTIQQNVIKVCNQAYEWALGKNIAKEQARVVLPEGLTETTLFMSGTLRSWIHYIQVREADGAQKEHREIVKECKKIILKEFPDVEGAFAL